ncbi:PREDICTED: mucin-5AC-like isoform X1 [Branchiostoma belcheri]|uniref:Mucin-5AC-like isoform X1 n=1 Tax=Branchiostoma belcheri TaxID=7741 RepID=A0A6P5ACE9_BRABE|nr:PREDICTED: mucin-5AC-like isoform X1 [Branchiostoma belcheri]
MGSSLEQAALLLILLPLLTGHTHAQTTAASSPLPDLASPSQPVDTSPQDAEDTTQLQATTEFYSSEASATETQPGAPSASGTATDPGIQAVTTASEAVAADNVTVLAAGATTTVLAATTEAGSTVARTATEQQVADNDTTAAPVAVGVSTVTSGPSVVDTSTVQMMATTEEVLETGFEDLVPGTDEQPDSSGVTKMPETTTTPPPVVVMGNTTVASTAVPGNVTENATRAAFLPFIPRTTSRPVVSTRASTEEPAVSTTLRLTTQSVPRTTTEDLSRAVPVAPPQTTTGPPTTTDHRPMITTTRTTSVAATTTVAASTTTTTTITTPTTQTSTPMPTTVSTPRVVRGPTFPPQLIPSKNQADLSNEESDNIVTVFFNGTRSKLTRNSWILQYDETFREDLSEIINDISAGLNVQPTDVIYVEPTPKLRREGLLEVSIFVYNRTSRTDNKLEKRDADQSTVSKDVVEAALNQMKDQYEQQDRDVEIVEVSPGLTAPQPALPTRQTSIFGEYFSLFIALIVIACVCVVIILLGVLYLCVRKKKGKLRDHEKVIVDDGLRLDSYQALDNPGATFTDDEILTGQNGKPKAEEAWTVKPSAPPPPNGRIAENTEEEDTHL